MKAKETDNLFKVVLQNFQFQGRVLKKFVVHGKRDRDFSKQRTVLLTYLFRYVPQMGVAFTEGGEVYNESFLLIENIGDVNNNRMGNSACQVRPSYFASKVIKRGAGSVVGERMRFTGKFGGLMLLT